jgi:hypothetical protein
MLRLVKIQEWIYLNVLKTRVFGWLMSLFYLIAGRVVWLTARTGIGSNACLKYGFLPLAVHFYSPVPDIDDLRRRAVWKQKSSLSGIDFNIDGQRALLKEIGLRFSSECAWGVTSERPSDFVLDNQTFSYGCAASTHSMIRHFRPARVIEIGSGMSSRVISRALDMNRDEDGRSAEYIIVDPYPGDVVRRRDLSVSRLLVQRVELLDPDFFDGFGENDILFIDSGHAVRIGSDVNFLFFEVLPRLSPGVIVHVHDIGLPYEYPETYCVSEELRQFWTEQYLLQAFLYGQKDFEVMLAMNFIMTDHKELFNEAFPLYDARTSPNNSGSFWLRRKPISLPPEVPVDV